VPGNNASKARAAKPRAKPLPKLSVMIIRAAKPRAKAQAGWPMRGGLLLSHLLNGSEGSVGVAVASSSPFRLIKFT